MAHAPAVNRGIDLGRYSRRVAHPTDDVAGFFSQSSIVDFYAHNNVFPAERRLIGDCVGPESRVLDVGVGAGRTTEALASVARSYLGIDIAQGMVDRAIERHPGIDIRCMSANDLGRFDDASFDVIVFSFNGIDHLQDHERRALYAEAHRLLGRGGVLIHSRHSSRQVVTWPRLVGHAPRRNLREIVGAARETARRLRHAVNKDVFRRGVGEVADAAVGGATVQITTPREMACELLDAGFRAGPVLSRRGRRVRFGLTQPWFYVAATRIDS